MDELEFIKLRYQAVHAALQTDYHEDVRLLLAAAEDIYDWILEGPQLVS